MVHQTLKDDRTPLGGARSGLHPVHADGQRKDSPVILCVDDDVDIQTTLELRLRQFDVVIDHAFYGIQGLVKASSSCPDLIILDHHMPSGDGQYILGRLKHDAATAAIPVIVLTGDRDQRLKHQLLQEGADAFLLKPIHYEDLLAVIRSFVEIRSLDVEGELQ